VDDAGEAGYRVEGGQRRAAALPGLAPAVYRLDGCAAPHLALEELVMGKNQDPLRGEVWDVVECDTNVAGAETAA
jgi:hypothetical protein